MQTHNPILDEFAKLTSSDMDLVRRDEHDALKAEVARLRAEIAALKGPAAKPSTKPRKPSGGTSTGRVPPQDAGG